MDPPLEGSRAEAMNKRGVVALFNREEEDAMKFWCEARLIKNRHFDSACNYILHRWSTAKINDAKMLSEMENFVFEIPHKGVCLKSYLLLAMGDHEVGLSILKDYVSQTKVVV